MARFVYYNREPSGDNENDCVTRAISLATNERYSTIRRKLFHSARLLNCEKLNVCCYSFLIEDVFGCKPVYCKGLTVAQFADLNPQGTYLVRIEGHLTCVISNVCYDTWNCLDKEADIAWRVD